MAKSVYTKAWVAAELAHRFQQADPAHPAVRWIMDLMEERLLHEGPGELAGARCMLPVLSPSPVLPDEEKLARSAAAPSELSDCRFHGAGDDAASNPSVPPVSAGQHDTGGGPLRTLFRKHVNRKPEKTFTTDDVAALELPPVPAIFYEVQRVINDPYAAAEDFADVIRLDPQLTSSLLRLVNSPLFKLPVKVETVSRAVALAGIRNVSFMALGTLTLRLFKERPPHGVNMDNFWRHSVAVAIIARELARLAGRNDIERFFIAGLLHDIGWLALCCNWPEVAKRQFLFGGDMDVEGERQQYRIDHGELGALLFEYWRFSKPLINTARFHHAPAQCEEHLEAAFVHVADFIARCLSYGVSPEGNVGALCPVAWKQVGIGPEELIVVVAAVEEQLMQLLVSFFPE